MILKIALLTLVQSASYIMEAETPDQAVPTCGSDAQPPNKYISGANRSYCTSNCSEDTLNLCREEMMDHLGFDENCRDDVTSCGTNPGNYCSISSITDGGGNGTINKIDNGDGTYKYCVSCPSGNGGAVPLCDLSIASSCGCYSRVASQ